MSKLGHPLYDYEDKVSFNITLASGKVVRCEGYVYIVDAYGTFEQHEEPSYDIMVDNWLDSNEQCLVKHIRESEIVKE